MAKGRAQRDMTTGSTVTEVTEMDTGSTETAMSQGDTEIAATGIFETVNVIEMVTGTVNGSATVTGIATDIVEMRRTVTVTIERRGMHRDEERQPQHRL